MEILLLQGLGMMMVELKVMLRKYNSDGNLMWSDIYSSSTANER